MLARLAVACAAALAAPAAAAATPVLVPLKPCYISVRVDPVSGDAITEDVAVAGSGFTPGALVTLTVDGVTAATDVPVDGAGSLPKRIVKAPLQETGQRAFDVTATEQGDATQTVTTGSLVTALRVSAHPRKASPSQRIVFSGRGFTAARPVWGHYYKGRRLKRTVRFTAAPAGPCGTFRVRRRQFPFRPRQGRWTLQIDQQRRWSASPATAFVKLDIFVRRELRLGG